jgi:hypothetical protein
LPNHIDIGFRPIVQLVVNARPQIKYRHDQPEDADFPNQTISVNLTDSTGYLRFHNLIGEDIQYAETRHLDEVSRKIRLFL